MTTPTILIIDDEKDLCDLLVMTLKRMDLTAETAYSIKEARNLLSTKTFSLILTDIRLPDGNGLDFVKHVQAHYPLIPIAVITAYGSMELAITALKAGAFDFLNKPVDINNLRHLVYAALRLEETPQGLITPNTEKLLGNSDAIIHLREQINKLARSQAPVHIFGQTGVGKELVANLIHEKGPRHDQPFVPVNCGAIPAELMESELFGHKKGSFTGAVTDKEGLFKSADKGTLFLDEVADLPLSMQVKLLRAIQEKAIRAVGSEQEVHIDVRILSATHKDLQKMVDLGQFREDLYYRINVIEIKVPSLSERPEDIPIFADHFLSQYIEKYQCPKLHLSDQSLTVLQHYSFPGNIRELENILERAITLCENDVIMPEDLQLPSRKTTKPAENSTEPTDPPLNAGESLETYLDDVERKAIMDALNKTQWQQTTAAQLLGITPRALRYRIKKLGIKDA